MVDFCVYVYWDEFGGALYVGQTSNKKRRDYNHRKDSKWYKSVSSVEYFSCGSRSEALAKEAEKIFELNPAFNLDRPDHELLRERHDGDYVSPHEQAKSVGLDSLAEVSRISSVQQRTLINWHKNKPQLFQVVLSGCISIKEKAE